MVYLSGYSWKKRKTNLDFTPAAIKVFRYKIKRMVTIHLKRDSGYADSIRNYEVILDGKLIGKIADGKSESFKASAGTHTLQLSIDYIKSNKLSFECSDKETVSFECRNTLRGKRYILLPLYLTILKSKYIKLKRVTG
jgi:hypothetical protein